MDLERTLWSQEAAGWAQALGTFLALWLTQRVASRGATQSAVIREHRAVTAALAILPNLEAWHVNLGIVIPGSGNFSPGMHSPKMIRVKVAVPIEIMTVFPNLSDFRPVSDPLQDAVFLSHWIVRNTGRAGAAFAGSLDMAIPPGDDMAFMTVYRDNVVRLRSYVEEAIAAIRRRFPDPNRRHRLPA